MGFCAFVFLAVSEVWLIDIFNKQYSITGTPFLINTMTHHNVS